MYVKELRENMKLSQQDFADKFHIPVANVQKWEQGINKPLDYVVYMMNVIVEQEQHIEELERTI